MPGVSKQLSPAEAMLERLEAAYPDAHCELHHETPFQLLVATVLSAQTTDKLVNRVTPALFSVYPDAPRLAAADAADVQQRIAHIGMFRQKTKNIVGLARAIMERHQGQVPQTLRELVELPGVGRKTANVVLGVAFAQAEGVVVDTHVQRLSQRLGWTTNVTPEKIEQDLMNLFSETHWQQIPHILIVHGRQCCLARSPLCGTCVVAEACPSAGKAEFVGRKGKYAARVPAIIQRPSR